jgi:hypothetical protein
MNTPSNKNQEEYNGYLVHDFEVLYPKLIEAVKLAKEGSGLKE